MKRALTIIIAGIIAITATAAPASAAVEGITKDNYTEWEKTQPDAYGYNKGECNPEYQEGEEYFYSEGYDHWNVGRVYDETLIPEGWGKTEAQEAKKAKAKATKADREIVRSYCKKHFKKSPKYVNEGSKALNHHKGKVLVEVLKTKSTGKGWGKTAKGSKVKYNKKVKKGKRVTVYLIYSPKTNAPDAVVAKVDNKKIR